MRKREGLRKKDKIRKKGEEARFRNEIGIVLIAGSRAGTVVVRLSYKIVRFCDRSAILGRYVD